MSSQALPTFTLEPNASRVADDARAMMLVDPGFGRVFTDHMAIARYDAEKGWQEARITARKPLTIDAGTSVLQ
jgi:branched-chain amino acid aminotransferase